MKRNKGFTLIELLVVIAIIGILSSVVLASLSNARAKGKDASVKSQMASLKAQGELYYSANETFIGVCAAVTASSGFYTLLAETVKVSGVDGSASLNASRTLQGDYNQVTCHEFLDTSDNTSAWAAEAPLSDSLTGAPVMYCSDSTGVSREEKGTANLLPAVISIATTACK